MASKLALTAKTKRGRLVARDDALSGASVMAAQAIKTSRLVSTRLKGRSLDGLSLEGLSLGFSQSVPA